MIYESRPNVTADAAAICMKSGNAVILRGGKEAAHSSRAIVDLLNDVAAEFDSIFTSLLLKEMRQTIGDGGLFGNDNSDVLGGLFDLYIGQHIATSTNLGIGNLISKYIDAQESSNAQDAPI